MDDNDLENIDDFGDIDEFMYWVTIVVLFLLTIVFLAGLAGFLWGMT